MSEGEQGVWGDQEAAFKHFDKDQDGFLNKNEFSALCCALFQNEKGETYPIETTIFDAIFTIFDNKKDQVIDSDEFHYCWQQWITTVLRPVTALVVVDVQNDFISGSLGLNINLEDQHGEKVIPPINQLLDENQFDVVVFTLDWHPENHVSFIDNIHQRPLHDSCKITSAEAQVYDTVIFDMLEDGEPMVQKLWPRHSVQNTWGSKLHQDLKVPEDAVFVYKGTDPDVDSYSAFWDNIKKSQSSLNEELQKRSVTDLFLCGIGYDVCVAATTRHAIEEGYRAVLVDNATRGVCDSDIQATKDHTIANNGLIVHSSQVKGLATGRDRHPVLAYKLALDLSKKMNKK
ncbi:nicotinamidase isoform X1 [Procambarus clarkii]|uniref:nicotinamidase isoform X1 n=1 Tax=Procambarus clarkii TaxID=6728 RepID=UPI003744093F